MLGGESTVGTERGRMPLMVRCHQTIQMWLAGESVFIPTGDSQTIYGTVGSFVVGEASARTLVTRPLNCFGKSFNFCFNSSVGFVLFRCFGCALCVFAVSLGFHNQWRRGDESVCNTFACRFGVANSCQIKDYCVSKTRCSRGHEFLTQIFDLITGSVLLDCRYLLLASNIPHESELT